MLKTLLRLQLRAQLNQLFAGRVSRLWLLLPVLALLFAALFYGFFRGMAALLPPSVYFSVFAGLSLLLGTLSTMFSARSALFEDRDNQLLLSLPIPWRLILYSRLALLLLFNLLTQLLVAVPAACCVRFPGWHAVLAFAALCLLLPLCATALSALLGWLLALLTRHIRHKSLVSVLAVLLFLLIYFLLCFRLASQDETALAGGAAQLLSAIGSAPPLCWMGRAALGSGVDLLLSCLCLLPPFLLMLCLLSLTFQQTVSRSHTTPDIRTRPDAAPLSVGRALLRRELRHFLSSSVYMLNSGMGTLLLAVAGILLPIQRRRLAALLPPELDALLLPLLLSGGAIFLTLILITAPSVSLEGKSLWLGQSLPVTAWQWLRAKLTLHCLLTLPSLLLYWLCMLLVARPHPLMAGLGLLYLLAMALLTALLGLYWGLRRARFDWLSETQVVKQGAAVGLSLLLGWLAALLSSGVMLGLSWLLSPAVGILCAAVLLVGSCVPLYRWLRRRGGDVYASLSA